MAQDYIPAKDAEFQTWAHQLLSYTATHATAWNVPASAYAPVMSDYVGWEVDYEKAKSPDHTASDILKKTEGRKTLEKAIRDLVNRNLRYNDAITDADRLAAGLPVPDATRTPVPPPTTQAEADILLPGIHLIELKIKPYSELARADTSRSDYGVRIYYGVLGDVTPADKFRLSAPPASGDDLPHSVFTRKPKHEFDFPEEDRGKSVYFCLRYENSKGDPGPWGPLLHAVIP